MPEDPELTPDPVGPAGDQCYKFVVKDERITTISDPHITGTGVNSCVYLSSAVAVRGEAVFVVCCRKKKVGEEKVCEECRADINLVVVPDPKKPSDPKIVKEATIRCKTPPP